MTGLIVLTAASSESSSALNPTLLLTWLTCLSILGGLVVAVLKYGRRIMQMVEDFNGESERPGVPARPGVMERLSTLDTQVAAVHTEVNYNHGTTIKDAITRIETDVRGIHGRLDVLDRPSEKGDKGDQGDKGERGEKGTNC